MSGRNFGREGVLVVAALTAYYLSVLYVIGFFADPDGLLVHHAPDSLEYLRLADWLVGGEGNGEIIQTRSYFYPLVAGLARFPFGNLGLWALQMIFWIAAATIFYFNLKVLLPLKVKLRICLLLLYCASLTGIYLSTMALTETLSLFLFAVAGACICRWREGATTAGVAQLLMISSLLTVTKPNYQMIYLGLMLLLVVARTFGRLHIPWSRLAMWLAISLVPLLIQFTLHAQVTGKFAFSNIGHHVLQVSLYSQVLAETQKRDFAEVLREVKAENPGPRTMLSFLASHPWITLSSVAMNLNSNIRMVLYLTQNPAPWEARLRPKLNDFYKLIHLTMLIPVILALVASVRLRGENDWRLVLLFIFFMLGFLPTGLSFWAADRWIAPFFAVWPLLYLMTVHKLKNLSAGVAIF